MDEVIEFLTPNCIPTPKINNLKHEGMLLIKLRPTIFLELNGSTFTFSSDRCIKNHAIKTNFLPRSLKLLGSAGNRDSLDCILNLQDVSFVTPSTNQNRNHRIKSTSYRYPSFLLVAFVEGLETGITQI